uniref:Cytochrome P450 4C1 n=1 Tax=Lygus hesperus TaxID=30085 RepID=A0A0A9ZIM1_LYGHE
MEEITLILMTALAVLIVLIRSWGVLFRASGATNIPGPFAWPIIGNAGFFLGVTNGESALKAFTKMAKAYDEPLNRIWLGPKLVILVKSPKYIEALLTHKGATSKAKFSYKGIEQITGNGVFTRKGESWQRMRKPLMSLLQPKNMINFQEIICKKVESMCEDLQLKTNKGSFDISPYIKLCSFEVLCEATMGMDNIEFVGGNKKNIIHRIEKEIENVFVNMWSWKSMLGLTKYSAVEIHKHILPFLDRMINERREQMDYQGINYMTEAPKTYIDVVIQTAEIERKNKFETSLLLTDFVIAGSDTQSIAIIVLLSLLAMHQEYQEKVYQELVSIFGHSNRDPNEEDLRKMVYLEMCLKETLRYCSPPAVARAVDEDILIDGYIIPKGAALLFALYLPLVDPQYWERPADFYPDHFQKEAVAKRPRGAFMPFVAGPKMCPGQLYSFQSMKTVASTLLRRFHFTTDQKFSELRFKYLLMREPADPLVKISERVPDFSNSS